MKYLFSLTITAATLWAFYSQGLWSYFTLIYAFGILPLLEWVIPIDSSNFTEKEENLRNQSKIFDFYLVLAFLSQLTALAIFIYLIYHVELQLYEKIGLALSMGVHSGVMGINVAHELGHRREKIFQYMAQILLLSSLYMQFFIEHNRGHHKNIGTWHDPSTARLNENLYAFWFRAITTGFLSAWNIESARLKGKSFIYNQMFHYLMIQVAFVLGVLIIFGLSTALLFILSAGVGIILLETVNYIEHYGLSRKKVSERRFEDVKPTHSWNSDHVIGRSTLFELSRHSDHHAHPHRKYQILKHFDESPQLPTGYPGMMILSLLPPLWFKIMNKKIEILNNE
jgi:alkane 1-monooxygenase